MPEKENNQPKTIEEMFVQEHLETKNQLQSVKDELASARRALASVSAELTKLKKIITTHASPIKIGDDGKIDSTSFDMYVYFSDYDIKNNAYLKDTVEYLRTIWPVKEKEPEEGEK